jgi:hypothetical protein
MMKYGKQDCQLLLLKVKFATNWWHGPFGDILMPCASLLLPAMMKTSGANYMKENQTTIALEPTHVIEYLRQQRNSPSSKSKKISSKRFCLNFTCGEVTFTSQKVPRLFNNNDG